MSKSLVAICVLLLADVAFAETIFYMHGYIVEEKGPQAVHKVYGLYDFPAVTNALAARNANVISEVRDSGTKVHEYARVIVQQIEDLIAVGESPDDITVVGFSKGGSIAIFVSSYLDHADVKFVFIAACSDWLSSLPEMTVSGHIMSIYEASDSLAGSCRNLADRNKDLSSFSELMTSTGRGHGAFYRPSEEWVVPLLDWIEGRTND
jgi:hypothetical protein